MQIGIVLSKTPSYSETFFISKIEGLQNNDHTVILFVQSVEADFNLCKVKKAYPIYRRNIVKQLFWFAKFTGLFLRHLKTCYGYIKLELKANTGWMKVFKKLYFNIHILTENLDWLHFGFATMALGKENVAAAIKAKMAVSFRGFDMAIYPIKHRNCYNQLWKQLDKVHTISDDLYTLAIQHELPSSVVYKKITPAIDTALFNADANKNFDSEHLKIITVARLHWKKGLTYTLQALRMLKDNGVKFQYTLIGEGAEYEKLMYIRHTLGLEKEVRLLGKVPHQEVKNLLENNDVYLQYSISEGFCNAVLEAQAMGLLCVVSDAEGLTENVLHDKSGWVVTKRKPELLAKRLESVFKLNKTDKAKISTFAKERVREKFNLEKQQREFVEFYQ